MQTAKSLKLDDTYTMDTNYESIPFPDGGIDVTQGNTYDYATTPSVQSKVGGSVVNGEYAGLKEVNHNDYTTVPTLSNKSSADGVRSAQTDEVDSGTLYDEVAPPHTDSPPERNDYDPVAPPGTAHHCGDVNDDPEYFQLHKGDSNK